MQRLASLLLSALALSTGPAIAEPEPFRIDGLPRGGALTIRESPDASAPAIEEVPVGRRVSGFGCTNDTPSGHTWCRVKFGASVGWARRRYLAPD